MPFQYSIVQGKGGTFRLSDPKPMIHINMNDVDELTDSFFSDRFPNPQLKERESQHPLYPGMILETADFEETSPEWPATPEQPEGVPGDYRVACHWLGDSRGTTPTKFINRSSVRTLAIGFDQFSERYISWNAHLMAITGTASGNLIGHAGNTFSNGDAVAFAALTGSSLVGASSSALPTTYYIINRTADNYQVSATKGGSVFALGTDISSGYVIDARFLCGTVHPTWPYMLVTGTTPTDANTRWRTVDVTYTGIQFGKPFHRVITCNAVQMSSSDPIAWDFPGGWTTELNSNVQLPEIGCVDTYLSSDTLPTGIVPSASASAGSPDNPPAILSVYITIDDSKLVHNWPNGWSIVDVSHVESLNSKASVSVWRKVWRYIFPLSIK